MHPLAHSALIGGAVMTVIAASFALGRGPVPVHQLRDKPFNDALHEDIGTLAMMSEQIEAMNMPKVVQTEPIKPEPDPLMAVLSTEPAPQPIRRKAESDICTKHGMHKVMVDKHRWRCRK